MTTDVHLPYSNWIRVYFVIKWNTRRWSAGVKHVRLNGVSKNAAGINNTQVKCCVGKTNAGKLTAIQLAMIKWHVERRVVLCCCETTKKTFLLIELLKRHCIVAYLSTCPLKIYWTMYAGLLFTCSFMQMWNLVTDFDESIYIYIYIYIVSEQVLMRILDLRSGK